MEATMNLVTVNNSVKDRLVTIARYLSSSQELFNRQQERLCCMQL